jgi:transcriptional regulator PpsR
MVTRSLTGEQSALLIAHTNDLSLVVDSDGIVRDLAIGNSDPSLRVALGWVGKPWIETVTVESKPKIRDLLNLEPGEAADRWRQVNHPIGNGPDLPIMYKTMRTHGGETVVAVGRDLRQMSQLQQQLLDVQHSLERDYARLHQAEIRYRMLFSMASEAMLFVDADSHRVVEANPAAGKLLGKPPNKLINRRFPRGFSENSLDAINELMERVRAAGRAEAIIVRSADGNDTFRLNATLVRREDGPYFLIRLSTPEDAGRESMHQQMLDIIDRSPDAFVLVDPDGRVMASNRAFLDFSALATELQAINQPIDRWLGRNGVDMSLLMRNLRERNEVRQFVTTLHPEFGEPLDVELSAVSALDSDLPCFGFVIRHRFNEEVPAEQKTETLPHSLDEMTQLVGRVPLKDLVRETTDVIERMCIEAALKMTGDSRASAAEMLGLSRQSLYVKLRRYGIGDHDDQS